MKNSPFNVLAGIVFVMGLSSPAYSEPYRCISNNPVNSFEKVCNIEFPGPQKLQIFDFYPDDQVFVLKLNVDGSYELKNEQWDGDIPTNQVISNTSGTYIVDGTTLVLKSEFGIMKFVPF